MKILAIAVMVVSGLGLLLVLFCPYESIDWDDIERDQRDHPENWPGIEDLDG